MEHWGFNMDNFDKMFEEWLGSMRNPTQEEWDAINNYIESIDVSSYTDKGRDATVSATFSHILTSR